MSCYLRRARLTDFGQDNKKFLLDTTNRTPGPPKTRSLASPDAIRTHGPPPAQEYRLRLKRPAPRALYEFPLSFPASFSLAAVSFSPEMNRSYLKNVRRFF